MRELRCTAVVRVTLQIELSQPWDAETTLTEVYEQAAKDALHKVEQLARGHRIVGTPHVEAVIASKGGA